MQALRSRWDSMQGQIHVCRADVSHFCFTEQQPGHGTAYDGELAVEAAEDLAEFDQDALYGRGGSVVVVVGGLGFYSIHGSTSFARWSAASRSRSLPHHRSR